MMNISSVYDVSEPTHPMSLLDILEQVETEYFQPNRSDPFNTAINRIAEVGRRVDKTKNVIQADEIKAKNQLKFAQMKLSNNKERLRALTVELAATEKEQRKAEDQQRLARESMRRVLGNRINAQQAQTSQRKDLMKQFSERIASEVETDQLEDALRNSNVFLLRNKENNVQAFSPTYREVFNIGAPRTIDEISRALSEVTIAANNRPTNESIGSTSSDEDDSMS